jgi:aspergillopepsin I
VVHDSVTIDNVTVTMQAVELAQQVSGSFTSDTEASGILGLSFSSLNTGRWPASGTLLSKLTLCVPVLPVQQMTFFDTAVEEAVLPQQLFTADLQKGAPGSYDFGYIDSSKYTGDLVYTDVDSSQGFWNVTTTGYRVGSSDLRSVSLSGIVDTGTSLLVLDRAVATDYWGNVNGASYDSTQAGFVFPCGADLPILSLGFAQILFNIPGDYLNYAPINDTGMSARRLSL